MNPDQVFVIVMGSIAAWTVARIFRGPLGEALARRIGGAGLAACRHQLCEQCPPALLVLRQRGADLESCVIVRHGHSDFGAAAATIQA